MTLRILKNHVHVTERERAHEWPDGRKDDSRWEDCTFVAGLEYVRLTIDPSIPHTHREAEALRSDAGKGPSGGSGIGDLRAGIRARYDKAPGPVSATWRDLWQTLQPGIAAVAQGSMGAFPDGHHLRRFDPGFDGAHAVLWIRPLGGADRVWWCDPLAPKNDYNGEWVAKSDARRFFKSLPGARAISRAIILDDPLAEEEPEPSPVAIIADPMYTQDELDVSVDTAVAEAIAEYKARVIAFVQSLD